MRDGTASLNGGPPPLVAEVREKQLTESKTMTCRCGVPLSTSVNFAGLRTSRLTRARIGAVGNVFGPVVPGGGLAPT